LVGVPAVHAEAGLLVVEPREEGQLLGVVGEAAHRVGIDGAGQRVAHLQIGLAAADLTSVALRRVVLIVLGSFSHSATSCERAEMSEEPLNAPELSYMARP
jgi:hypothetical protein